MSAEPAVVITSDDGREIRLLDVVAGENSHLLPELEAMHARAFARYDYARAAIPVDAMEASRRDGIVVHQFVLTVDGRPAGFSLVDVNIVRRVAPNHFLYVEPDDRDVTINGARLGIWFLHHTNSQIVTDGASDSWGAVCEADDDRMRVFSETGWVLLDASYREPARGWLQPKGDDTGIAQNLMWLPRPGLDVSALLGQVRDAAAAAFLLDMYQLASDHPLVQRHCGSGPHERGPRRR